MIFKLILIQSIVLTGAIAPQNHTVGGSNRELEKPEQSMETQRRNGTGKI